MQCRITGRGFVFGAIAISGLISGCIHSSSTTTALVPDLGPRIETKNKYRISEVAFRFKDGSVNKDTSRDLIEYYQSFLAKYQDGVFSDGGLPFKLTVNVFPSKNESNGGWTFILFFMSATTLPFCMEHDIVRDFDVALKAEDTTSFQLHDKGSSAITLLSPVARLITLDEYEPDPGFRGFGGSGQAVEEALAYGLAVRLKELEDAGKIAVVGLKNRQETDSRRTPQIGNGEIEKGRVETLPVNTPAVSPSARRVTDVKPIYNILSCKREAGSDFSYRFELELLGTNNSLHTFRTVQQEFRRAVREDYAESIPGIKPNELYVDFPEYELKGGKIEGRAVVLAISVTSLVYDPATRNGKLAVKVNANQYEEARKWIRKNIETLARDKNIALVTGEIPPVAKFYLGREELKDGNVLEIEFRTVLQ